MTSSLWTYWIILAIINQKGDVYLKNIALLLVLLLLLSLPTTFAEQENISAISDFFTVIFPEDWTTKTFGNITRSISPTKLPTVAITSYPISISRISLDERIIIWQNYVTTKKIQPGHIEESYNLYIDNRQARLLLYSTSSSYLANGAKTYWITCLVYGDQYIYDISVIGKYDDLETDRKTINEILSSIKILK